MPPGIVRLTPDSTRSPRWIGYTGVRASKSMSNVEFQGVSKSYPIYDSPGDRLKELITPRRYQFHRDFWALRDVSFDIRRGETFCIVGENGSGKSTLLQMVAGILQPTSGTVTVTGRVSALLELGSGFNPEFSGRDNVYLNGSILGLSTRQIDEKFRAIEDFAEISDFIHQPVKTYSSGMVVRLAFAVAISVDPEILLVDEALAVGDIYFRQRCMRKVHELRVRGVTILFVSHSTGDVKAIADRVMWLDRGHMMDIGDPEPVNLLEPLTRVVVRISVRAKEEVPLPIVGFMMRNHLGMDFSGTNTSRESYELPAMAPGDICTVDFHLDLP